MKPATTERVSALFADVADVARSADAPDDAETARRLLITAMAVDRELLALCRRIQQRHQSVRPAWERWRQERDSFDPAGEPPPDPEPEPEPEPEDRL